MNNAQARKMDRFANSALVARAGALAAEHGLEPVAHDLSIVFRADLSLARKMAEFALDMHWERLDRECMEGLAL